MDDNDELEDSSLYTTRVPNSTRRYQVRNPEGVQPSNIPARAHNLRPAGQGARSVTISEKEHQDLLRRANRRHFHWLFFVGLAMITMLIGWVLLTTVSNWWQVTQDDWHFGRPRTYQIDVVVGHNDSASSPSHFIALNLRGQVEVIEFPGGDATKAKVYLGPHLIGANDDLAPVTLTFQDVNGDRKIDMVVNVQGNHFTFLNNGSQFHPQSGDGT